MSQQLTLSRYKLATFLACQRRFQLRFLQHVPWPVAPVNERIEGALERGQQFHQLAERHFQGLPAVPETIAGAELRRWWLLFQESGPEIPAGWRLPEISLTISVGRHLLTGRFDLLIVGQEDDQTFAHIYDWKTGKAQDVSELREDWQTRLYLALLAEGGRAFLPHSDSIAPANIAITYWTITQPAASQTFRYNRVWHEQNWRELQALVDEIDQKLDLTQWPLTDDWTQCRQCAYQSICGRQAAGLEAPESDEIEELVSEHDLVLEPELP